jgi:pimeloyl-ACP methyl ester carboxylesterase
MGLLMAGLRGGLRTSLMLGLAVCLAAMLGESSRGAPVGGGPSMPSLAPPVPPEKVAEGHLRRARQLAAASCELEKKCDWHAVDGYYTACEEAWNAVWTCPGSPEILCEASEIYADALQGLLVSARDHGRLTGQGLMIGPKWRPVCVPIQIRSLPVDADGIESIEAGCLPDDKRISRRHARGGFGLPVSVRVAAGDACSESGAFAPPRQSIAATAVLRFAMPGGENALQKFSGPLARDHAPAILDLANPVEIAAVQIGPARPLLAGDLTVPLLDMLDSLPKTNAIQGFIQPFGAGDTQPKLEFLQPHQPGRIPVVFIHGLASDEGTWFDMLNELRVWKAFHRRFEPWLYHYPTGASFLQSSAVLRRELTAAVQRLDPQGQDPALKSMVLVGHSMGGLHAKLQVVESGTAIWEAIACRPFDEIRMRPEMRRDVAPAYFFHPLPFVKRVVFIATPHSGAAASQDEGDPRRDRPCESGVIQAGLRTQPADDRRRARAKFRDPAVASRAADALLGDRSQHHRQLPPVARGGGRRLHRAGIERPAAGRGERGAGAGHAHARAPSPGNHRRTGADSLAASPRDGPAGGEREFLEHDHCEREGGIDQEQGVHRERGDREAQAPLSQAQPVEALVHDDQGEPAGQGGPCRGMQERRCHHAGHEQHRADAAQPGPPVEVERGGHVAGVHDQLRPWFGTVHDIVDDHRGESPLPELLAPQLWIEHDPAAVVGDPHAELDVFRGRVRQRLVEPADIEKGLRADGPAARPEAANCAAMRHVRVVMEQVAKHARRRMADWFVVVGTEQPDKVGIGPKRGVDAIDRIRGKFHVCIDEEQDAPAGRRCSEVAGDRRPGTSVCFHDPDARAVEPRGGRRSDAVEGEDDLGVCGGLIEQRQDAAGTPLERACPEDGGHDHGHIEPPHVGTGRDAASG